jgi:acetyl esterase/lipase
MPAISTSDMARASATGSIFSKVDGNRPTLVFIHGGYWQHRAKEIFALFAEGPTAHGINVALIGYTLAPEATLDEIVAEIHRSLDFLGEQLPALGGDASRIVVSGWSAGGHLTAMALSQSEGQGAGSGSAASTTLSRSATAISTSSSGSMRRCRAAIRPSCRPEAR